MSFGPSAAAPGAPPGATAAEVAQHEEDEADFFSGDEAHGAGVPPTPSLDRCKDTAAAGAGAGAAAAAAAATLNRNCKDGTLGDRCTEDDSGTACDVRDKEAEALEIAAAAGAAPAGAGAGAAAGAGAGAGAADAMSSEPCEACTALFYAELDKSMRATVGPDR